MFGRTYSNTCGYVCSIRSGPHKCLPSSVVVREYFVARLDSQTPQIVIGVWPNVTEETSHDTIDINNKIYKYLCRYLKYVM